ncbi:hypothetical protein [Thiocapsa bogorovii]|uniref:hypothetical protein n=1 Tax=Thiocapsa bogorovii TaxID=521689 RepID=UPI001E38DDD0|nr:hypothetical protein [Thiocapsa bogorovii]UHD18616.1 hypothetical protein LT988_11535 [Thiocapsa bogorovii]
MKVRKRGCGAGDRQATVSAKLIAAARSGVADGSIPSRLTTTSIMILAVLGGLEYSPPSARIVGLFTLVTGTGLYVASVYGDGFGREFATGKTVSAPELQELLLSPANITALMLWLWTTLFFVAAAAGLLSLGAAFQLSELSLVALLFGLGYGSPRKSGRTWRTSLRDGLIVAAIGWFLADMRMLAELVKQF